ncbi:hypothetical protein F8388_011467 [Cannabis sativa]|uniref:Uncharacterized protein n=1 Tax=Cannabis sativa TaxID=3483 RepID=A0A7J6G402_CANSA|nr:hypothetical protein F8388_011467 [Cannabis sativa]
MFSIILSALCFSFSNLDLAGLIRSIKLREGNKSVNSKPAANVKLSSIIDMNSSWSLLFLPKAAREVPHSPSSPQPLPPFSSYSPSPSPSSPWRREQLTKSPSPRSLSRENHYVERQSGKLSPRTLADWRG